MGEGKGGVAPAVERGRSKEKGEELAELRGNCVETERSEE